MRPKRRVRRDRGGAGSDAAVALLASRQHGVVSRRELLALGLEAKAITRRIEAGRLHPIYRGVYAVGHPLLSREGRWMAAVLAGGEGAVLSHRSAAALWGLIPDSGLWPEITTPTSRRSRPGITIYSSSLPADEVGENRGIPVTTVARTVLDVAGELERHRLAQAIDKAEIRRLGDRVPLTALVERYSGRRGVANLRTILAEGRIGLDVTKEELEFRFATFIEKFDLPRPEVNAPLLAGGVPIEVDCLWRDQRLIVELDSRTFHDTSTAFERDRARDRALMADGWRVIRITWRQLHHEPDRLAQDLRRALCARTRL